MRCRFSRPGPQRRFPRSRWWPLVKLPKPLWIELEFTRLPSLLAILLLLPSLSVGLLVRLLADAEFGFNLEITPAEIVGAVSSSTKIRLAFTLQDLSCLGMHVEECRRETLPCPLSRNNRRTTLLGYSESVFANSLGLWRCAFLK